MPRKAERVVGKRSVERSVGERSVVRINKYFTQQGYCSRRAADQLIEAGRVRINDRVAVLGDQVTEDDVITVDGRVVDRNPPPVYLAYHKPIGVTCTTETDVKGNILHAVGYRERIFPIGRLDKDSSGLILLTNDGELVNRLLRPEFGHEREYVVTVDRPFTSVFLDRLERGVRVLGRKTRPCRAKRVDAAAFRITLTEGRNRQVRRMCAAVGYEVKRLVRVRVLNIPLKGLAVGQWRRLTRQERDELLAAVGLANTGESRVSARPGRAGATGQGRVSARPGRAGATGQGHVSARPGRAGKIEAAS